MCNGGDSGSSGGSTGGIGFSDTSAAEAASQAGGKTAAGGLDERDEGSVNEQIDAIRKKDKDKAKAKKDDKTGQAIGTIVGLLSPVPGGAVIGGALGSLIDRQRQKGGLQTGSGPAAGSPGEGGLGGAGGGEGGEREMTSFPSREAAAKTVLASEQDKRRALRGRKATILTSPRGVTTEAPGRKTLLGQ